jgi:hypothetical protein
MTFERRGTVYAAWLPDLHRYTCYWDASPDDPPKLVEQGPDTRQLAEVLSWAAERARRVLVRPEWDDTQYYWAGNGEAPSDVPPLQPHAG